MARITADFIPAAQLTEDDIEYLVSLGRQQAELMNELEAAVRADDLPRVLTIAARLVGLETEVKQ